MRYSIIEITFPNGCRCCFNYDDFEFFPSVSELQHKTENIIINTGNLHKSFFYETNERGEIIYKTPFDSVILR